MRKYFTKYLPVEGEIFQNNQFLFKDNLYKAGQIDQDRVEDFNHDKTFPLSQCKKVKLFLCTSEIKLGDTWYSDWFHPYPNGEVADTNTKVMDANMSVGGPNDEHHPFKVVGEVSINAVWVTDRMEFEENEVEIHVNHRKFPDMSFLLSDWEEYRTLKNKTNRNLLTKLLCPTCKTFH